MEMTELAVLPGLREILEGMLDVLHEKEWIKGSMYRTSDGHDYETVSPPPDVQGVCLEGACILSLDRLGASIVTWRQAKDMANTAILRAASASSPGKLDDWMLAMFQFNDRAETTREDVILAVKTALANLEE